MSRVFLAADTERSFRQLGFSVVPLLEPVEIETLTALALNTMDGAGSDFFFTSSRPANRSRREVSEAILAVLRLKLAAILPYCSLHSGLFATKRPHSSAGTVPLHQDYSTTDGRTATAIRLWCPLVDVDARSGCLIVVPGSHAITPAIRPFPHPWAVSGPVEHEIRTRFARALPMNAGAALLYDERLIHGSDENLSDRFRIAVSCILLPTGSLPRIYLLPKGSDTIQILEVHNDTMLEEGFSVLGESYPTGVVRLGSMRYDRLAHAGQMAALATRLEECGAALPHAG